VSLLNIGGEIYGVVSAGRSGRGNFIGLDQNLSKKTKVGGVTIYATHPN